MKVAVIDLGTNTCNLLIAEISNAEHKILHQSKQLVKLGDGKIKENELSIEAAGRTINSFREHKNIIQNYDVQRVVIVATSAVRTANNKIQYLEKVGEASGWLVKVISGEKEAELIFKGVLLAFKNLSSPSVILDIGGGSNELILAHNQKQLWKESQPTGMARVINSFPISDPISNEELDTIRKYFVDNHGSAFRKCKSEGVSALVGCSGAFDTVADLIDETAPGEKARVTQEISLDDFYRIYQKLIQSTRAERLKMKGMDYVRVDLIVPALILIECLISMIEIEKIIQTDFALREGVLYEIMEKQAIT